MRVIDHLMLIAAAFAGVVIFMIGLGLIALYRFWFSADRREQGSDGIETRARAA